MRRALSGFCVLLLLSCFPAAAVDPTPADVVSALGRAGDRRPALEALIQSSPAPLKRSLEFLVAHMPDTDLQSIEPGLLATNTTLAHEALASAPWASRIPEEIFLNDVLPYACVNEPRENWRPKLRELSLPLVRDCSSPSEAARRLNERLFPLTKVRYSTQRRAPDQGPLESMESGKATCTGLSILLADACRSIGVPARIVGTPLWANLRGNHTWVEIWDGDWHFLGAAEPDPAGLDRGWFVHDASQAKADEPRHAIYASSFRRTGTPFPLVWARNIHWVPAVNVTARYTPKTTAPSVPAGKTRLLIKVLDQPAGHRVHADIAVYDDADPASVRTGRSRDESVDLNDILPFEVPSGHSFRILARSGFQIVETGTGPVSGSESVVVVALAPRHQLAAPSQACYLPTSNAPAFRLRLP
jgi:hypothetical protein